MTQTTPITTAAMTTGTPTTSSVATPSATVPPTNLSLSSLLAPLATDLLTFSPISIPHIHEPDAKKKGF